MHCAEMHTEEMYTWEMLSEKILNKEIFVCVCARVCGGGGQHKEMHCGESIVRRCISPLSDALH